MQLNTDYLSKKPQKNQEEQVMPEFIFSDEQAEEKKDSQTRRAVKS